MEEIATRNGSNAGDEIGRLWSEFGRVVDADVMILSQVAAPQEGTTDAQPIFLLTDVSHGASRFLSGFVTVLEA